MSHFRSCFLALLLMLPMVAQAQFTCRQRLPYFQDFEQGFAIGDAHGYQFWDTTWIHMENCWTQYIFRAMGYFSLIGGTSQNRYLSLSANHPVVGQNDRVQYTLMVSPPFDSIPTVVSFDMQYWWGNWDDDDHPNDSLPWHAGILQLGYCTNPDDPIASYFRIANITIDPAAAFDHGGTEGVWQHYRLDLRTLPSMPTVRQFALKPNCNMDSMGYVMIYVDNFRVADEMDTVDYSDTVCLGEAYIGYGFTVDSSETATPGIHRFFREALEIHGMVHYRLSLFVPEPDITEIHQTIPLGDSLRFLDSLITDEGDYTFSLVSSLGCDSLVVLHLHVSVPYTPDSTGIDGGIWFPNAFTPDAETNNRFVIQTSLPVEEFEMTIYTRNGLLVWHSEDIDNPWDGTRNGTPLLQGAYVYHWRLKSNNRVRSGLGTITLLR